MRSIGQAPMQSMGGLAMQSNGQPITIVRIYSRYYSSVSARILTVFTARSFEKNPTKNTSKRPARPGSVCYDFWWRSVKRFSRKSQKTAKFGPIGMNGILAGFRRKKPKTQPSLDLSSTAIFHHRDTIQSLNGSQDIDL